MMETLRQACEGLDAFNTCDHNNSSPHLICARFVCWVVVALMKRELCQTTQSRGSSDGLLTPQQFNVERVWCLYLHTLLACILATFSTTTTHTHTHAEG